MDENTEIGLAETLTGTFEQSLSDRSSFEPQELPMEWDVGQHRYIRVNDGDGQLNRALLKFREDGVKVLDYDRRWGFWVFKTMAPPS